MSKTIQVPWTLIDGKLVLFILVARGDDSSASISRGWICLRFGVLWLDERLTYISVCFIERIYSFVSSLCHLLFRLHFFFFLLSNNQAVDCVIMIDRVKRCLTLVISERPKLAPSRALSIT